MATTMPSLGLVVVPNEDILDVSCDDAEFIEIHLDKLYDVGENSAVHNIMQIAENRILVQGNIKHFWDPDQCIDFITSYEWRKIFLTLTDEFSYLLSLIHDLPQIVYIYIYSRSPNDVPFSSTDYPKLRATVNQDSLDANNQLLIDISKFKLDLMPINVLNPTKRETKLLIQEPLIIEEYLVIWVEYQYDSRDFDMSPITDVINKLDIFYSIEHCIDAIKSSSDNTKIFLISSHADTKTILKEVENQSNIIAIYLFDHSEQITCIIDDFTTQVRGRYSDLGSLSYQLSQDYKNSAHNSPLSISIFHRDEKENTVRDLSKESARFLWLQLLTDILIRTPYNDQSKEDMLTECRIHYKDNQSVMTDIDTFEKTYKSTEALTFYTNASFLYRLFNRALRTENIDFLFTFRFVLADMYNQLQKLYSDQFVLDRSYVESTLVVYRGQSMKLTEFDHIKENVGSLISVSTFFSATTERDVAAMYSGPDVTGREPGLVPIMFQIEVDPTNEAVKRPYASIKHLSRFPDECEVLFSVGSFFRIISVDDRRTTDGHWYVRMTMTEDDSDISELRNELENEYMRAGTLCDLGNALIAMCDYDRAERYFRMLLEYLPESNPSFGVIQGALGIIFANRGDYQTALKFQEQALKFWATAHPSPSNKNSLANTYVHMGAAYRHLGQLDLALKYISIAADMQLPTGSLAFTYNEMAITQRNRGDHRLALQYFLKSLEIDEKVLKKTKYHPKLAIAYNNIGEIYVHLNEDENALKYLERALELRLKCTDSINSHLAAIYENIGTIYRRRNDLRKSLEMHEKALDIDSRIFHGDHESIANGHRGIAMIYISLRDFSKALYHAEKGLRMLLRLQEKDNCSVLATHQYTLAMTQLHLNDTTKALKMGERALENLLKDSSANQEHVAAAYDLLSNIHEKEGQICQALAYAEKAVEYGKMWALRNGTFQWEHFALRLDKLKNDCSTDGNKGPASFLSSKASLDNTNLDETLSELNEALRCTPSNDIRQKLLVLNNLIATHSRKKQFSMLMKYFDEANSIYTEHQSSDISTKVQLEGMMIYVFFSTALVYYHQQDWNMSLTMLTKALDLLLKEKEQDQSLLTEIYYHMALSYAHRHETTVAIHYYQLTISVARKRLTDDHPDMQRYCLQLQLYKQSLSATFSPM